MILHHLQNSRSQRIIWLLEEIGIEYEIKFYSYRTEKPKELKFPTVELPDQKKLLTETSAIAEFICAVENKLTIQANQENYWDFCFYKNYADSSFMVNIALKQVFQQIKVQTPLPVRFIPFVLQKAFNGAYLNPELKKQLEHIDQHLSENAWLAGDVFSYADILLWFPLHCAEYAYPDFRQYNQLNRYLEQIRDRSAFQAALERGQWSTEIFKSYWDIG